MWLESSATTLHESPMTWHWDTANTVTRFVWDSANISPCGDGNRALSPSECPSWVPTATAKESCVLHTDTGIKSDVFVSRQVVCDTRVQFHNSKSCADHGAPSEFSQEGFLFSAIQKPKCLASVEKHARRVTDTSRHCLSWPILCRC